MSDNFNCPKPTTFSPEIHWSKSKSMNELNFGVILTKICHLTLNKSLDLPLSMENMIKLEMFLSQSDAEKLKRIPYF